jgi:hypothetical protein
MAVDTYALTTLVNLKSYLGITVSTDDTLLERCIDRASYAIENYTGRQILTRTYVEWRDTFGTDRIRLSQYPVTQFRYCGVGNTSVIFVTATTPTDPAVSVAVTDTDVVLFRMVTAGTSVTTSLSFSLYPTSFLMVAAISATSGFSATATLNVPCRHIHPVAGISLRTSTGILEVADESIEDYKVDFPTGVVYGRQLRQYQSVVADYTAGYSVVPYDVEQACLLIASRMFRSSKRDPSMQSESIGGYSYSLRSTGDTDSDARELLAHYKALR